jgi:uncharacterized protein (DUF111 family)
LVRRADAGRIEAMLFAGTTTLGVRRSTVERSALAREMRTVVVDGHPVRVKVVTAPDGRRRLKPECDDVLRVADATGCPADDIFRRATAVAWEHM